jgi:hypothetical protein
MSNYKPHVTNLKIFHVFPGAFDRFNFFLYNTGVKSKSYSSRLPIVGWDCRAATPGLYLRFKLAELPRTIQQFGFFV